MNRLTVLTKRTLALTLVAVAGLVGLPGSASAQTPPRPPVAAPAPPAPVVAPTPMPAPAPRPMLIDLAGLDQMRLLNLDDIKLAMPPISVDLSDLSARLATMDFGQTTAVAAQAAAEARAAREASRDAMDRANVDSMRMAQTYAYDYNRMGGGDYNAGKDLMNRRQYEQAITRFDKVIAQKGNNIDG